MLSLIIYQLKSLFFRLKNIYEILNDIYYPKLHDMLWFTVTSQMLYIYIVTTFYDDAIKLIIYVSN